MRIRYYFVEGNISAGKTTFLTQLASRLRAFGLTTLVVVPEPLRAWRDVGASGHNIFALACADAVQWSYKFQLHVMMTRVAALNTAIDKAIKEHARDSNCDELVVLCERSVYTDRHVFVEQLVRDHVWAPVDVALYEAAYEMCSTHARDGRVGGVVYLRASPDVCAKRIVTRGRAEERGLSPSKLRAIHAAHERVIADKSAWGGVERLVLDVESLGDLRNDGMAAAKCAQRVYAFIEATS